MADVSRKDFLGLSAVAAVGMAGGCAPKAGTGNMAADLIVVGGKILTQD